jgi:hypothetical protein
MTVTTEPTEKPEHILVEDDEESGIEIPLSQLVGR